VRRVGASRRPAQPRVFSRPGIHRRGLGPPPHSHASGLGASVGGPLSGAHSNQSLLMSAQQNAILSLPSVQQTHQQRSRMPWSVRPAPQHQLMLQPRWQQQQQQQQLCGHSAPTIEQSTASVPSQTTGYSAFAELKATVVRGLSQIRAQLDQMSASIA